MLLSNGAAMYDRVLHKYLQYYINYQVTLDHFLTGLNSLGTGRLTFQVLDPTELTQFLYAIARQLHTERSSFALAFNHTYQYYAEPMVTFSNMHDQLLVNIPVLLHLTDQKDLILYSIDIVLMPFDTGPLDGKNLHSSITLIYIWLLTEKIIFPWMRDSCTYVTRWEQHITAKTRMC